MLITQLIKEIELYLSPCLKSFRMYSKFGLEAGYFGSVPNFLHVYLESISLVWQDISLSINTSLALEWSFLILTFYVYA